MSSSRARPQYSLVAFDRDMRDYWGRSIPRRIRIGKFGRALSALTYDSPEGRAFLHSLERSIGLRRGVDVERVSVELYQEGLYQWVLRCTATAGGKRRGLCFTVAKDAAKFSQTARREYLILKALHARNTSKVVKVLEETAIPLAGEREGNHELFAYFSRFLHGYTELGIDARHRFHLVGGKKAVPLSERQSERVRGQILELLASLYDPKDRSALVDIEVNSGDFMGRKDGKEVSIRLIAARHVRRGFGPGGLLRNFLKPMGEHAEKEVLLYPRAAATVLDSLLAGFKHSLGSEADAVEFVRAGLNEVLRKRVPAPSPFLSWEELAELLRSR